LEGNEIRPFPESGEGNERGLLPKSEGNERGLLPKSGGMKEGPPFTREWKRIFTLLSPLPACAGEG